MFFPRLARSSAERDPQLFDVPELAAFDCSANASPYSGLLLFKAQCGATI